MRRNQERRWVGSSRLRSGEGRRRKWWVDLGSDGKQQAEEEGRRR